LHLDGVHPGRRLRPKATEECIVGDRLGASQRRTFEEPCRRLFIHGAILPDGPPGSLAVGTHALRTIILDPTYGNLDVTVQFSVLPC
jgi:hypothetical protein